MHFFCSNAPSLTELDGALLCFLNSKHIKMGLINMLNKKLILISAFAILIFESSLYSLNNKTDYIIHIKNCSSMEQLFEAETIKLQLPQEYVLGAITAISIANNNNILIADEQHLRLVLMFNNKGKFIKQIGGNGKGPGEYISPHHVLSNNKGEIIISDPSLFRISCYKSNGDFLHSFSIKKMIEGMALISKDEILIHDQFATKIKPGNTIFSYNRQGKPLCQFGETSKAYHKELKNIPFSAQGPFLAVDADYVFEMDYPDYHIRKYWNEGKSKKEFGIKPHIWRSLLTTNYKKIPLPKMVDATTASQLDKYFKNEFVKSTYIDWIHILTPGILMLMVHYNNTGDMTKDNYFVFYNTDGNLIKEGFKFKNFPKSSDYFYAYLLPVSPYGLCIVQYENTPEKMLNIQLIFLKPKRAISKN